MTLLKNLLLTVCAAVLMVSCSMEQEFSDYMALKEPRIDQLDSVRVMVCKIQGKPGDIHRRAMRTLYRAFDQLQALDDSTHLVRGYMRSRWPEVMRTTSEEWIGLFALPVPDSIRELPVLEDLDGVPVVLEWWQYGSTAQILHLGSYETDDLAADRLHRYIIENGFRINGLHEEEYISGPGMYFDGNPERYVTIIRYPVSVIEDDTDRILDNDI